GKLATEGYVPPFALSFWRWVLALVILLPFAWPGVRQVIPIVRGRWGFFILLGLLGVGSYNTAQYWGLQHTTALNTSVVLASMPAFMFLGTWLAGQERANIWQLAGLVAVTAGILIVAFQGSFARAFSLEFNMGDLAILFGVAAWVAYSVLLRRLPKGFDPLALIVICIIFGLPAVAPFWIWELATRPLPTITWTGLGIVLYAAIFPGLVASIFWNRAVVLGGANLAGIMNNLTTVFAVAFAVLLLDETFAWYHAAGMALVFAGIYCAAIRGRRPVPAPGAPA
ncbi:MAG: DMT family transporter, partial [Alphaproteobacteria bacterium]